MSDDLSQPMEALKEANRIRIKRASVKRDVKAGKVSVKYAMNHPECLNATVIEILSSQHRWGRTRSRKLIGEFPGLSESRRCVDLTKRQVDAIQMMVNERNSNE